jgi:hypothetical protein
MKSGNKERHRPMMTVDEEQAISRVLEKLENIERRVIRVESKLSQFMEEQGIKVGALRPIWKDGDIILPSLACTTKALVSVIPNDWPPEDEVAVFFDGEHIMSVYRGEG